MSGILVSFDDKLIKFSFKVLFFLLNLNHPHDERSIIEIFFRASLALEHGIEDGGSKTIILPLDFATNESISISLEQFLERFEKIYSSSSFEIGFFKS
mgnify:CR=1 FL=1